MVLPAAAADSRRRGGAVSPLPAAMLCSREQLSGTGQWHWV